MCDLKPVLCVFCCGVMLSLSDIAPAQLLTPQQADTVKQTANELDHALWAQVEPAYLVMDRQKGGYRLSSNSSSDVRDNIHQARMTWVAAEIARLYPDKGQAYKAFAEHGLNFLARKMWDNEQGGFFFKTDPDGKLPANWLQEKHVYSNAFSVYAAANAARVLDDPKLALELAKRGYHWIESHALDKQHGGYFEAMTLDGKPILTKPATQKRCLDSIGTAYGYKSMNSHIHLLEAYTELYKVWPDEQLRVSLEKLLVCVRDVICIEPGALNMFFTRDWRAVPNGNSFGHDVETAFLMTEAAHLLGEPWIEQTQPRAKLLVDHALEWGYDKEHFGFYDNGRAFRPAYDHEKIWWVQAEAFNALALMHQLHGKDNPKYFTAMLQTWAFTRDHMIDDQGQWHVKLQRDGMPVNGKDASKHQPQDIYHSGRAMMHTYHRLMGWLDTSSDH